MNKRLNIILTIILFILSFYYTHLISNFIKEKDPIMVKIKENKDKFEHQKINAIIKDNTIIPGLNGKIIDINKSYSKMKKVNKFSSSLFVYKEINPDISLTNHFDKLIIKGNNYSKNISLVLYLNDINILKKLNNKPFLNIMLDNNFINNNLNYLTTINNNIIVLEQKKLENIWIIDYCFSKDLFYAYCSNYQKYTIKPIFITNNYFYNTYNYLENGMILAYNIITDKNLEELKTIVSYLNNLHYNIVSIDELIKE